MKCEIDIKLQIARSVSCNNVQQIQRQSSSRSFDFLSDNWLNILQIIGHYCTLLPEMWESWQCMTRRESAARKCVSGEPTVRLILSSGPSYRESLVASPLPRVCGK